MHLRCRVTKSQAPPALTVEGRLPMTKQQFQARLLKMVAGSTTLLSMHLIVKIWPTPMARGMLGNLKST